MPVTEVRGRVWRGGKPQDDFEFSSISDYLTENDALVWCDIYDPDQETLTDLAQELGLNSWAVEDVVAEAERTKAAVYRTHTFFTVYSVSCREPADDSESTLETHRISGFVLPQGLITVRLSPWYDIDTVSQRFDELGGQEYGVGSLVHGLLDVVGPHRVDRAVALLDVQAAGLVVAQINSGSTPETGSSRPPPRLATPSLPVLSQSG